MRKGREKRPSAAYNPATEKLARGPNEADLVGKMPFRWSTDKMDWAGPYGWGSLSPQDILLNIIPKLHQLEQMTWAAIDGPTGSHFVDITALSKPARKRLAEIDILDTDQLFSLRLGGKIRVWGVRDVAILRIIWWDPEHEVCPSMLAHT